MAKLLDERLRVGHSHKEKRPQLRAFERIAGPEFEVSTRSGCRCDQRPLQASRLPAVESVKQLARHMGTICSLPMGGSKTGPQLGV